MERRANRLSSEKSPYLLQHAANPVDWYPWCAEAFQRAAIEDKPIFLSIGYSACHWCHVMERESFEDAEVARILNEHFISIKVDREERPDIDNCYMLVCQAMTGSGGWPLTIFMTPDRQAFFAGTYFPKVSRGGMIGMLDLLPRIVWLWREQRGRIRDAARNLTEALKKRRLPGNMRPGIELLEAAFDQLTEMYDRRNHGFGDAPKFPTPHIVTFLLRYWSRTGRAEALKMADMTLKAMRRGGIFDHVGFGFHRYSTDAEWLVPHFEKMIYDQALLAIAYAECHQATGNPERRETAEQILEYVLRDMTAPEGGFYCAQDADSGGQEGGFYLWTESELKEALPPQDAELATIVFGVTRDGNFTDPHLGASHEKNILHMKADLPELAGQTGMDEQDLRQRVESIRRRLFEVRRKRPHPLKDDKALADYNGLMIAAMAVCASVFGEPLYARAAERAAEFVLKRMQNPAGGVFHRYREGEAAIPAFLDDYQFLIWGLIELYEATFEARHLSDALELNAFALERFWNDAEGGFDMSADGDGELPFRHREAHDGAIPSGNSVAMLNLVRLARMTGTADFEEKAWRIASAFSGAASSAPAGHTFYLSALDHLIGPSFDLVIAGRRQGEDTRSLLSALGSRFAPRKTLLLRPIDEDDPQILNLAPFVKDMKSQDGGGSGLSMRVGAMSSPDQRREADTGTARRGTNASKHRIGMVGSAGFEPATNGL